MFVDVPSDDVTEDSVILQTPCRPVATPVSVAVVSDVVQPTLKKAIVPTQTSTFDFMIPPFGFETSRLTVNILVSILFQ